MSSAIEVLKSEKILYVEKIKKIESRFNGMPSDIKESYQKSVKVYQEFIDALDEALLALEKQERLKEWLEKEIRDCEKLENIVQLEINKDIFTIKKNVLKEVLERVGEQK